MEVELLDRMVEILLMDAVHGLCLDLSLLVATPLACQHKQRDFPCLTPDISACREFGLYHPFSPFMKRQTTKQSNNRNETIRPFKELLLDLEVGMPNIIDV